MDFAVLAEMKELARKLWGDPTQRSKTEFRYGTNGSKSLDLETGEWFDHEAGSGGEYGKLYKAVHGRYPNGGDETAKMEAGYDYHDEHDALLFQVQRFPGHKFFQRAWIGGAWRTGKGCMQGVRLVPYHLPAVLGAARDDPLFICEGEKDADNLRAAGCNATTNPGGAGKWRQEYNPHFAGLHVCILPDNDEPGRRHAKDVARNLRGTAASVIMLALPGLAEKGDVSDWLAKGGDAEQLYQLWREQRARPATPEDDGTAFPVTFAAAVQPVLDCSDFVEGLLLAGDMSVIYGESNSGKTFFATDLAYHVAAGIQWCDREVEKSAVLYCALEGSYGIFNRIAALNIIHQASDVQLAIIPVTVNMLDPEQDLNRMLRTVTLVQRAATIPVRLIVMDTLSRAIAGGNENSPEDMGTLVMNSARLQQETGAHVAWVHHSGKDQAKGARGHSLLRAATGTEIEVYAEQSRHVARVTKQREMECSGEFVFTLKVVDLGTNQRGRQVTSCIAQYEPNGTRAPPRRPPAPTGAQIGLRALDIALSKEGAMLPPVPDLPANTFAVSIEAWRTEFYELKGGAAEANRQAFNRAQNSLIAAYSITQKDGLVWRIKP